MAAKDVKRIVNMLAFAGVSKPTAKLGQALGPLGLNMGQVCKDFNDKTSHIYSCLLYTSPSPRDS